MGYTERGQAIVSALRNGATVEEAQRAADVSNPRINNSESQPSASSGPLSAYTDKKWINTGGGRRHVDNFEVRNGKIFDVASENAAIRNTQANYEQFLNGKLKEYGSGRTGRFGQYTNNFMDINRYAEHEMFMSTVNVNNLEKQLKELQKEYEKVRISGTGGSAETDLKKQIAKVESQIKEYQLDAKAAGEYMNLVKESQAAEDAWNKAQEAGLNSMDWYDQTMAEYDDIQQQLDDLYDQRRNAVRAAEAEDYSGWATDDLSAASIGGKNKADVSNIEGQIIRLTYQQDELKKQLGYANRYRWESVDTTDEQAIALGKATYEQQHKQWTDQMDTVSKLPTAGDYGAASKRMLTLSTSKDYKEPTEDWTEQQKNTYYVLLGDGSDTRRADEYAMNTNNLIQQQKNQAQANAVGEAATSSFYSGAWRTAAATGAGLASGLEYLGDVQELVARGVITEKPFGLADYNQAVIGSISSYLNNQYGTLGENAGVLAGKGLGDAYQIAQSVGQSWAAMALTGGSSAAVNVMFFGQAAKQTLDEQLAKGTDPYKAVLMGALAGSAEVIGETFSLENIKGLQAGQTKGILLDILRSAGIEGSEEGVTTLLNTFADRIVNGNDSDYYVALEGYISQGMSYADAERAAMKDWVNGIAYDMIAGAVSGGISGGVGGPAVRAANEVVTGAQEFDGDTKTLLDTAASYKDTKAADLATKYGGKESITVRQAGKLGKAIEKATEQQNERNIHNAISAELKARGVTSNTGDISDAIQKSASGKMLTKEEHYLVRDTPGARDIRDELFDRMTNGKLDAEKLAAEDTPQWLKSIEQKNGAAVAGEAMFGKFQREAAEQRLTEADRIETINPEVTIGDVSGKVSGVTSTGKTAQITITGSDGKQSSVNLEDALESGAIPSDVAYLAISAAAFGTAANDVYNLYSPTQTAREYIAAMDAAINTVAANVGSRSAFEQSDSAKYLTKEQRDFAWSEGQKQRTQVQENTVGKQDKGKKKTQPREGRVSYGGVTYEGQTFKATTADKVKPEVLRVLEKFAAATGVNIVFYESEADQRGNYVGANGFYRNGTVYLDVHAGANSTSEKEAVLITAAHEFTHFIRENAPRRYNQLKEFVTEHLLENGYDFETLVERKIKAAQKDGGLSRDAAVEEVVADACEMVLGNSNAIERLAKEKPGLAKRIADWLHEFFADIRKAFEGVEARHEEAKAMLDYMDELAKLWDDALVEAAESGGEVSPTESGVIYDNAGNPVAESTGDGTVMLSIRTYEEEGRDVLRKYLDTAVAQKKLTKTEAKDMAEEIERIYDICREFEGKYAQFGAWSRAEVVRDTHGRPVFSVVSPNGEYKMNLDFSLVCKKRRTLDAVFNEMARRGIIDDFELGQKSVVKINEIIRKHGFETACALCFVDAKRFRQASMADQFVRLYNELVTSLVSDDQQSNIAYFNFSQNTNRVAIKNGVDTWSSGKLDFSHLNHVMNTYGKGTVEYKAAKYIKDHAEGRKLLQRGDFMSSSGFDAVKIQNKTILKLYNSKKGTGGPKAAFGDVQYLNEIVRKAKSWTPEKAFAVGGVRVQSFSDYIPRMVFDYVQMIYDLAAVGLPAHAYTKETLFAKQFGLTGIKINMSLIPAIAKDGIAPGLDANGDYVWAGESFNYDEAVAIQNADGYTENCGTICVGVSEAHIRKLLRDPNIRMVIPYHKSGLNPIVAHMNKIAAFTDYTTLKTNPGGCQNTIDKNGNKVEKDFNFNAAVQKHGDPRAAADEYLKWCAANQYTAKFAEFANEDNYYKLLEDFTLYDNAGSFVPQRAVKAVFPAAESAFGSMKELIEAGLQEDAVIEGKRDKTLSAIVDEIEQTLPKTEAEIPETEVKQADRDIEAIDSRTKFSLREVEPIQPSSDKWKRTLTTAEAKSRFPSLWDVAAEESEVRNPTQISSTVKSYRKIYDFLKAEGFDGTILDASSGLGYGTRAGIEEYGFDVEDIEPYPDKSYNPKYKDYSTLNKKYDVIISNAVLNVLPQDQRDALTIKMGELLNDGGRIFINVRGKDVDTLASTKTNVNISPMEWFVGSTGSYQKGFTKPELVAYLQDALGDGFSVKPTNLFGAVSAVVTKDGGIKLSDGDYSKEPNVKKSSRDSAEGLTKEEARAQAAAYTRLKAENAELRRRIEYWKRQTQRTKQATVRQTDVNRFARQLIKRYGSTADQAYIRQALQEMGDYLVQNDGETLDYDQLRQMAVTVAAELVATAEATEESSYAEDVAGEILSTIRNTDIRLDRQYFNDLPEGFRRDFRGKLHIFTDKGRSVDSIYAELQEEYGYDLFPVIDNHADQLVMMGDIFDRLSAGPEIYNPFRGAENEATLSIANEIMDTMLGEDIRQTAPTMKDKADAKVAEVKAEGKQALNQLRSDKNARIQEIRRQESIRRQEVRAKEKAAKWDKVAEVKAYYQNMQKNAAEKRRENAASKKYRDRVFDKVNTLETWLRKNTDKEHIPEALKEPLIAFLSSIDLTSKQQLKGKGPTQRDIKYTDALQKIKDIVENQAKYLNDPDNANGLDVYLDIPNGFDQSIKDHIESVNSILSGTDLDMSGPVVMMSSDQLKDLDFILTVLTNSIKKINQYITESHFASVMEGARESNAYMKELGKSSDKTVIGDNAEKFTLWSNTLPYYAFKRFGAAGVERFQALMNGWGKMAMNVQTVMQFTDKTYSADEAKRWEENVRTIDLSDGSQVRMTDAQIMGLWCLARREQGLGHILVGGIRVGDIEPKGVNKKRIQQNDASHLTQDDLNSIFGMLSDRQIEVAKKLQEFLNTTCSEWGNDVSMARFGYRQFTEQFYYPINVDRNNLPMSDPQARETDIFRLLNMSATKALTPNANNSVVINSIFDVFAAHTADMAKYNGLALPILDLLKWYNYKDKTYRDVVDSLGNITTQMTAESVQSVMERTYGKMAQKYVMNFMKDLNGVREGGRNEELLKGMVGRYKAAAVGFNLRVVIQQPTSIARAAYVIDPRYLARGMAMKGGINEAMQNSGLAVWKSLGYFDTNIARNMRDQIKHTDTAFDKFTEKSMKLAELGDKVTWGAIWNAAKLEVKETRHLSGDALLKATQERFDEIILSTQVMDSTISRSDMMRNQSLAVSDVTSFRSEPTVTYNMLMDSYMDFNMELRKTKSASTAFRRTGMKMVRAATVYAVTTALTAAAAAIVDAFRDDDDYQTSVEKWIEHFWDNVKEIKEPWRLLPIVDQLYDIFLNNDTPDSMLWQSFVQLKKSGASAIELLKTVFGDNPEATSRYTAWGKAYTVLQGLSSISGLPVSAAYRDLKAIWNASGALLWPDKKIKFYDSGVKNQVKYGIQDGYLTEEEAISILVESGDVSDPDDAYWLTQEWLHADDSEWTRYNDLYAAILSGDEKAFSAAQEALGDHGIAASSVRTEAKNEIGRLFRGDDGTGRKMDVKTAVDALRSYAGLGELEAQHLVDEWRFQVDHDGMKLSELDDAYVNGLVSKQDAVRWLVNYGHEYKKDAEEKALQWDCEKDTGIKYSNLNDAYIHEEITEQQAQSYLMKYGGLTQAEAESKTLQWDLAKDYGIQYGSTDEGIKKALTEEFIDQETAITIMETYGGKTHEEAEDYSYQYLFTKETGYNFSEIQQAFDDGVITEEEMAKWYRLGSIYTHGSEETSNEYVEVAKWKRDVPGADSMNRDGLEKWDKYSGKLQAQGLGKEDFAKVWSIYSKAEAEYDSNGNQTKEKAEVVMEKIGQLTGYNRTQLTALGYSVYSAKKVNAYKTW